MEHSYDELLKILADIHTEPAFSNIKKYIYSHRSSFSPEQFSELEKLIKSRDSYFNPKFCNWVKEVRAFFKDDNGHEFSIAYSDGKAQGLCNDAKEEDMAFHDYLNYLFARQPNFVAWTLNASGTNPMVSVERREAPMARGIRRGIEQGMEEEMHREETVNIDVAGLLNNLRADMEELVRESMIKNTSELEKLRDNINRLESRLEQGNKSPEKNITRVLDSSQYRYFIANAYKLKLPVVYSQIARGQYQVSIKVQNESQERNAMNFIDEAEKHETVRSSEIKVHSPGYREILDILCRTYEREAHMPCGLSRTGALSTLATNIADYAHENGIDWEELDIASIDLFAKPGKIYTSEQGSEAFDTFLASSEGKKVDRSIAEEMENDIENNECTDEEMLNAIENYDAITYLISRGNRNPELRELLKECINVLKPCNFYPNRLDEARNGADRFLRQYGGDYQGEVDHIIHRLGEEYR